MSARRPSLTQRLADQAERAAFASLVRSVERFRPHDNHARCEREGVCLLSDALEASSDRITNEGAMLANEQRKRRARP